AAVHLGILGGGDRLRVIHSERDLVGKEVASEVYDGRESQVDDEPVAPPQGLSADEQHGGEEAQQKRGLERVGGHTVTSVGASGEAATGVSRLNTSPLLPGPVS